MFDAGPNTSVYTQMTIRPVSSEKERGWRSCSATMYEDLKCKKLKTDDGRALMRNHRNTVFHQGWTEVCLDIRLLRVSAELDDSHSVSFRIIVGGRSAFFRRRK